MAVRDDFTAGEVLAAADLNDTFGAKLNLAGGKVLQVVRATDTTLRTTTSTSFVDVTGMSVTITPQKSDSSVLVIAQVRAQVSQSSNASTFGNFAISDSSNNALSGAESATFGSTNVSQSNTNIVVIGRSTPGTTSATTYKLRFSTTNVAITISASNATQTGQMYAIEVSA
jgi:hypothetical protein